MRLNRSLFHPFCGTADPSKWTGPHFDRRRLRRTPFCPFCSTLDPHLVGVGSISRTLFRMFRPSQLALDEHDTFWPNRLPPDEHDDVSPFWPVWLATNEQDIISSVCWLSMYMIPGSMHEYAFETPFVFTYMDVLFEALLYVHVHDLDRTAWTATSGLYYSTCQSLLSPGSSLERDRSTSMYLHVYDHVHNTIYTLTWCIPTISGK